MFTGKKKTSVAGQNHAQVILQKQAFNHLLTVLLKEEENSAISNEFDSQEYSLLLFWSLFPFIQLSNQFVPTTVHKFVFGFGSYWDTICQITRRLCDYLRQLMTNGSMPARHL